MLNECCLYLLRRKSQPSDVCAPTAYTAVFTSAGKLQQIEHQVTLHVIFRNVCRNITSTPSYTNSRNRQFLKKYQSFVGISDPYCWETVKYTRLYHNSVPALEMISRNISLIPLFFFSSLTLYISFLSILYLRQMMDTNIVFYGLPRTVSQRCFGGCFRESSYVMVRSTNYTDVMNSSYLFLQSSLQTDTGRNIFICNFHFSKKNFSKNFFTYLRRQAGEYYMTYVLVWVYNVHQHVKEVMS